MDYEVNSISYLKRARVNLDSTESASLFYAAFELRCGIEARMKEYLDAQAETNKKRRKGWKIDKLARQIEDVFKIGHKNLNLIIFDAESLIEIARLQYTSVSPELQKMGERLGNYLHSQEQTRVVSDSYWREFKGLLEMTYKELEFATSGKLLAPPLVHTSGTNPIFFCVTSDQREVFPVGKRIGMHYEVYELEPLKISDFV